MSQNDFVIANDTAANVRADINLALQALASTSSGATAPATTYANMLWYDTATNFLYMRSEADDAWIKLGTLDQSTNTFSAEVDLPTLATATWETGTATDEALISPVKLAAAVAASGTSSPVKAYVKFNGIGTIAISASLNVSSVTDLGVGSYRVNFTTSLSSANYGASVLAQSAFGNRLFGSAGPGAPVASNFQLTVTTDAGTDSDSAAVYVIIVE
jgi:hypothetical protein